MPYCTLADITDMLDENEIIRYTDDAGTGLVNTSVTDKAIAGADALIDSHLAARYSVPVQDVPDIIIGLAVDIAIYKICSRRSAAPDEIRRKYDDAVRYLEKVAAGKIIIPKADSAPADTSAGSAAVTSSKRVFSRSSLQGF